jgi:hypothetical protein
MLAAPSVFDRDAARGLRRSLRPTPDFPETFTFAAQSEY